MIEDKHLTQNEVLLKEYTAGNMPPALFANAASCCLAMYIAEVRRLNKALLAKTYQCVELETALRELKEVEDV